MPNKKYLLRTLFLFLSLLLFHGLTIVAAQAQEKPTVKDILEKESTVEEIVEEEVAASVIALPPDRYNRQTPRSSIKGFAQAVLDNNYELAMEYMDTRYVPQEVAAKGPELARELKIIAKRAIWVGEDVFSDDPAGHTDDGLPGYRDLVTALDTPEGLVNIYMQRVPGDEKGTYIWKISNHTVAQIPRLYKYYGYGPIGDYLSQVIPEKVIFHFELWQWHRPR